MCELIPSIVNALKPIYIFNSIYFWTDSSIVFCCMKNDSKIHKPNVQRTLNKIREVIKHFSCLKLIPSKMNPADSCNERFINSVVICK